MKEAVRKKALAGSNHCAVGFSCKLDEDELAPIKLHSSQAIASVCVPRLDHTVLVCTKLLFKLLDPGLS